MKRYRLLDTVVLVFIPSRDPVHYLLGPDCGGYLECDGRTVWYVRGEERHESITNADIITAAIMRGAVEEITDV